MKLIIINGSTCSGKSTVIKSLLKERDNFFHLSYDALKWSFSKYNADNHYKDVQKIVLETARTVFKMGYDVLSDSTLYKESRNKLISLAKEAGYDILEINLETDFEVLAKRFDERVASALLSPERKISNLSKDRFKELFNIFNAEKSSSAIIIRTDNQSIEDVVNSVNKLL